MATQGPGPMDRLSAWWASFSILPGKSKSASPERATRARKISETSKNSLEKTSNEDRTRPPGSLVGKRASVINDNTPEKMIKSSKKTNGIGFLNFFRNLFTKKPVSPTDSPKASPSLITDLDSARDAIKLDASNLKRVDPQVLAMVNPSTELTFLEVALIEYPEAIPHIPDTIQVTEKLVANVCRHTRHLPSSIAQFADKFPNITADVANNDPQLRQYLPEDFVELDIDSIKKGHTNSIDAHVKAHIDDAKTADAKLSLFQKASPLLRHELLKKDPDLIKNASLELQLSFLESLGPLSYTLLGHANEKAQYQFIDKNSISVTQYTDNPLNISAGGVAGVEDMRNPFLDKHSGLKTKQTVNMLDLKAASHKVQAKLILDSTINPEILKQLDPIVQRAVLNKNISFRKYAKPKIQAWFK